MSASITAKDTSRHRLYNTKSRLHIIMKLIANIFILLKPRQTRLQYLDHISYAVPMTRFGNKQDE